MGDLLEQMSPAGDVSALVEDDGNTVYFYLRFANGSDAEDRIKACWVRNLVAAPPTLDRESMVRGGAPILPVSLCNHPQGAEAPEADRLHIVWFEEGNGAVLFEDAEILSIIPPWSGRSGFTGYARDCTGESPVCWPLPTGPTMNERIHRASEFWALWDDESFFQRFRDGLVQPIEKSIGRPADKYYAIDGRKWPPKAMLRFNLPDRLMLLTIGVSVRSQPSVESSVEDASLFRRIELSAAMDAKCPEPEFMRFAGYVSGQSGYPWTRNTWLGEGHTMPCDAVPLSLGGMAFDSIVLTASPLGVGALNLPPFRGDRISLLWMIPITAREREYAVEHGSASLLERLRERGVGVVHRSRPSVV